MPTHAYCTAVKRAHVKCKHAESRMDPQEVIACFVYGLSLQIYELYIKDFNIDPASKPGTLGAVMAHALAYLQSAIEVNPSLSKVLDHSGKAFVAYSTEESSQDGSEALPPNVSSAVVSPSSPPLSPLILSSDAS